MVYLTPPLVNYRGRRGLDRKGIMLCSETHSVFESPNSSRIWSVRCNYSLTIFLYYSYPNKKIIYFLLLFFIDKILFGV